MQRALAPALRHWLDAADRLPLVLRGARQVGKTWLVRDLARASGRELVEVNFERDPQLARSFAEGNFRHLLGDLELALGRPIRPATSLLFLDEVQAAPAAFASLRWFAEELPALPVIAAGSLLEFALADETMRMPVGRVTYRHVEPMGFGEFLQAHGQDTLLGHLQRWLPGAAMRDAVHAAATNWYERYAMVGGMPAVVAIDVSTGDAAACRQRQSDLATGYRDDFQRYAGRLDTTVLANVLSAIAHQLGDKFVHARIGEGVKLHQSTRAIDLLAKARVITQAPHSTASAIPLAGQVNMRNQKAILLDIGLAHALSGTPVAGTFPRWQQLADATRGRLTAQLAGQQLRCLDPGRGGEPSLHYWQRSGGRPGEIDYLLQTAQRIVPVELKAGAAGAMKSLHQFMAERSLAIALRSDTNTPSLQDVAVKTTTGELVRYHILNLPGYLLWRAAELLAAVEASL
jgi:uncharacterized protein